MADDTPRPGSRDAPRIGVDAEGLTHYHDDENGRMLLTSDGDVREVHSLDGRPVREWIDYVRERRGWRVCFWERAGGLSAVADEIERGCLP